MRDECWCLRCKWRGQYADTLREVMYRETRTDPAVIVYRCPVCQEEVTDGSQKYVAFRRPG